MPVDKHVIERYHILDNCFRNMHKRYGIDDLVDEVNSQLSRKDLSPVSKRSIQKDIADMQAEYNIVFDEDLKDGRKRIYRYADTSRSAFTITSDQQEALLKALEILDKLPDPHPLQYDFMRLSLLQISRTGTLSASLGGVDFQDNLDHRGREHFIPILGAIQNRQSLRIVYHPYHKDALIRDISPYLLKQHNERWYLLASVDGYESLSVFPLDRIEKVEQSSISYKAASTDVDSYFDDMIGVSIVPGQPVETIKLKVAENRYPYIETKPLHWSQTELKGESAPDYRVITIKVRINNELKALILSFGDDIEVLEPEHLKNLRKKPAY